MVGSTSPSVQPRCVEGDLHGVEQRLADVDGSPGTGVDPLEIGVVAEAAAPAVDGIDLDGGRGKGAVEPARVDGEHDASGAERHEVVPSRQLRRRRAHDPPEATTAGW